MSKRDPGRFFRHFYRRGLIGPRRFQRGCVTCLGIMGSLIVDKRGVDARAGLEQALGKLEHIAGAGFAGR